MREHDPIFWLNPGIWHHLKDSIHHRFTAGVSLNRRCSDIKPPVSERGIVGKTSASNETATILACAYENCVSIQPWHTLTAWLVIKKNPTIHDKIRRQQRRGVWSRQRSTFIWRILPSQWQQRNHLLSPLNTIRGCIPDGDRRWFKPEIRRRRTQVHRNEVTHTTVGEKLSTKRMRTFWKQKIFYVLILKGLSLQSRTTTSTSKQTANATDQNQSTRRNTATKQIPLKWFTPNRKIHPQSSLPIRRIRPQKNTVDEFDPQTHGFQKRTWIRR